jgi:hypothetical protein
MLLKFFRLFPLYWLLTVTSQMIGVFMLIVGAIAGVYIFNYFWPLPPKSSFQGLALIGVSVGCGIYAQSHFGTKWRGAFAPRRAARPAAG